MRNWRKNGLVFVTFLIYTVMMVMFVGCGDEAEEFVAEEQPISMENVLIATEDMYIEDGTQITVELWMTEGVYFDEEHEVPSIYVHEANYQGNYLVKTLDESGKLLWEYKLENLWNAYEGEDFNFTKSFAISEADYNGDGCPDFTLGQPASSSTYVYTLLTLMPDGRIEKLCESDILCSESKDFSVVFRQDEAGENILVDVWNNALGEVGEETYIYYENECLYVKEVESEASKGYMEASRYEGYMDEGPYEEWKEQFGNCDFDEDEKRDRIYREVTDKDIAYRIDFGNGDVLELARSEDFFMSVKIEAADVCGFYGNEILFVGQHSVSTDPSSESDIYLYESTYNGYERILLPGQETEEDVATGIETTLSDRGDGLVKLECPAADYEEIFDWKIWSRSAFPTVEFFDISGEPVVKATAYDAAFVEYGGISKLVLYQNVTGKWVIKDVSFLLNISQWDNTDNRRDFSVERLDHGRFDGMTVDELATECYDGEIPIGMEHVPIYIDVVNACIEEYSDNNLTYNLIYLDEDGIPELAVGMQGYWVSLYTYKEGGVYEVMDQWPYGAGGNAGYEYIPYENVISNLNADYAGLVLYESYYMMDENYELNDIFWLMQSYEDEEGNVLFDESEEDYDESNWHFYYENREITSEEYASYSIEGKYEYIDTPMSAPELIKALYAPLFY